MQSVLQFSRFCSQAYVSHSKRIAAEKKCREAVDLSNELPKDVILERTSALSLLASAIFLQQRYAEAIPIYQQALDMDRGYRKPDDADLARDHCNLARAFAMTSCLALRVHLLQRRMDARLSKRRCVAMIQKELVRPLAAGMSKGFVSAWELAPETPKEEKK